ncbi:hypothetical protein [Staphylococcus hominis]|uniref:hypothetical protein n=1 Tax=Staphylococcus hominis TaxID=1290 RepID=UPI001F5752BD|nr:hypothetical protein [Staphylococcus hominis]MCI2913928.1 hypothetical protein [Staphylococcus hominis]
MKNLVINFEDKSKRKKADNLENYISKGTIFKEKKGEKNMHESDKEIFQQFERRIDEKIENHYARVNDRIDNLNSKIDSLPKIFSDKLKIALIDYAKEEKQERKDDKKTIIGWTISGTSAVVAILGLLGRMIGWF